MRALARFKRTNNTERKQIEPYSNTKLIQSQEQDNEEEIVQHVGRQLENNVRQVEMEWTPTDFAVSVSSASAQFVVFVVVHSAIMFIVTLGMRGVDRGCKTRK